MVQEKEDAAHAYRQNKPDFKKKILRAELLRLVTF